jgi:hypothetical protein
MRDLDRLKCFQAVNDGELQCSRAAERLGLTARQVRRLVLRYRLEGPIGLVSRHRHRPSNHRLKVTVATTVVQILRERAARASASSCRSMAAISVGSRIGRRRARRWCTSMMRRAG